MNETHVIVGKVLIPVFGKRIELARRLATSLLLFCAVLQLGACPCGCLEHNAWVQLFGLMDDHKRQVVNPSIPPNLNNTQSNLEFVRFAAVDGEDHHCDGAPLTYLDTADAPRFLGNDAGKAAFNACRTVPTAETSGNQRASGLLAGPMPSGAARAFLQIFLL